MRLMCGSKFRYRRTATTLQINCESTALRAVKNQPPQGLPPVWGPGQMQEWTGEAVVVVEDEDQRC